MVCIKMTTPNKKTRSILYRLIAGPYRFKAGDGVIEQSSIVTHDLFKIEEPKITRKRIARQVFRRPRRPQKNHLTDATGQSLTYN